MMETTIMDCISRIPSLMRDAVERDALDWSAKEYAPKVHELILVGSGTSYTASVTAAPQMEKVCGLRTSVLLPDRLIGEEPWLSKGALYLFVSQTGTSRLTREALNVAKRRGLMHAAVSESLDTPLARMADRHIDMRCGREEYLMRTIGYSMTVFCLIRFATRLGLERGALNAAEVMTLTQEALETADALEALLPRADVWALRTRRTLLRADVVALTGAQDLFGVALEGAVKLWEMPQLPAVGYELDEVMHGPNFGFNPRHCLIVLDDGGCRTAEANAVCRYMKNEMRGGLMVGPCAIDEGDLTMPRVDGLYRSILYAGALQVMAYELATTQGRDLRVRDKHEVMYSYFNSHTA